MWFRALLTGVCLAGALGACGVIDPVDQRYDTVGRSLAKARNEAIFLNLVRASHDYPLSFTTIANVTPTLTNTTSFGLPAFLFGPLSALSTTSGVIQSLPQSVGRDVVFGNTTANNSTAVSTNFNVATQETSAFYLGFLKPIDLQTLNYFIRQDYPRELLFWLFADSFQIGPPGIASVGYQYNPPESYGCAKEDPSKLCFREWVLAAVLSGLTVEERTIERPNGGGGRRPGAGGGSAGGGGGRGRGGEGGGESGGGGGGGSRILVARFCFSPVLARQAMTQMGEEKANELRQRYFGSSLAHVSPLCGDPKWDPERQARGPQPDTFDFTVGTKQFRVMPRSAYGVFEFLGNLMRMQRENLQPLPIAYLPRPEEADPPIILTVPEDQNLITVVPGSGGNCFVHTWFFDGDYCVPESASNTKRIFSLLAQLIAIQTAASDLSITPVVRVIQ
jgi:uncharacterized membrane protein YgcG